MAVTADVVIAGGGVIGTAIAWRAATAGLDVVLADPAQGDAASLVAAGMLAPVSEALFGEGELLRVNLLAVARFPSFAAELEQVTGHRVGLRREGTLAVAYDAGDYAALMRLTAFRRLRGAGRGGARRRGCRELEPFLAPDVHGGVLFAGDWSVDNRRYAAALREAAAAAGVRVVRGPGDRGADRAGADGTDGRARGVALADGGGDRLRPGRGGGRLPGRQRWTGCPRSCGPRSGRSRASCCGCGTRTACRPSSPARSGPWCAARTSTWCRGPTARWSWAPPRRSGVRT